MKSLWPIMFIALVCCVTQQTVVAAAAQSRTDSETREPAGSGAATQPATADSITSPALTAVRRPLYRLHKSDVLEIGFTFAPEFDQTVSVQPDGFIALKGLDEMYAEGLTLPELHEDVRRAYSAMLHDPEISIVLKDYEKPFFIAAGEVRRPGKYELRAETTVTEAVAIAGGFSNQAKHSQVVLFRRVSDELAEARVINVKAMLNSRNLREDMQIEPGDLIYVPQNMLSKMRRFLPASDLSLYANPAQF
ncbi:MAG TPA: polysaccharide biosynthesis/export family protein [Terriglobales bacterium]|nr:polysaccharide biosynthesis/export family protein [Terriglobales bacterium]